MPHKDPEAKRLYMREYLRKRRENPEFRKKANQRTLESRNRTPDAIKRHAEASERYREKYPDRVKETMQRTDALPHRVASRDKRQEKWLATLTEAQLRAFQRNWRTTRSLKKAANGGNATLEQWLERCRLYGNRCAYCTTALDRKAEMDHVIPVSRGGTGWPSNLVPACRSCNAHKSAARWTPKLPKPSTIYFAFGQSTPRLTVKES